VSTYENVTMYPPVELLYAHKIRLIRRHAMVDSSLPEKLSSIAHNP
jgi:hypothetical protein